VKPNEIREMSADDLQTKIDELTRERFNLRFRSATESIENPMRFRDIRRDIARMQTILQEKQTNGCTGEGPAEGGARPAEAPHRDGDQRQDG
jgi:large subunit ribosomal protein L29